MKKKRKSSGNEDSSEKGGQTSIEDAATVVVGTYDGGLCGFGLEDGAQTFGYSPHVGSVRAVHCSKAGKLASGGTDNAVRLFDLAKSVEMGELQEHQDTVSSVQFWGKTTLVTGSAEGLVCLWRTSDWELLLKFRGHKSAVTSMAVHPSGRLMASSARDSQIRLWDLTRGTSAAALSVEESMEELQWSPSGKQLAALSPKELVLVDVDGGGSTSSFKDASSTGFMRVSFCAMTFLSENLLALGDGKGDVRFVKQVKGSLQEVFKLAVEEGQSRGRVKALCRARKDILIVGCSTGSVEIWKFPPEKGVLQASDFKKLRTVDTRSRLTCLSAWVPEEDNDDAEIPVKEKTKMDTGKDGSEPAKKKKRKKG
eukprot:TRINITY_DN14280_c1_g1_i1.p1 TRINITY_DN14280_c1_g1~~TRINITY_DN14280_c1_g1_i1.p1  ORF type:complete len:368 (-),score=80.57 TRINITY_DN14280_c1_g1_i1:64-1167(-)